MKKAVSLLLIVCLAITLLAGCSGNASQPSSEPPAAQETAAPQTDASQGESEPAAKKTMVIGDTTFNSENWEETVDPHRTYNGWACIRYGIGETLVHYTDSMELEPWLAKSWENDGNLTWTITLQERWTQKPRSSVSSICWKTMTAHPATLRLPTCRRTVRF